ncbi:HCP-like protein [Rozella allomycis CSF55]|uniref:HCP-like protein n=1 Tax=Rozella allomycis (strain CSF55) TaxID=988480 RepID=A0A4P9YI14_ROZAC|nr:HCP-like protein [Rozella allomycis CSF55]
MPSTSPARITQNFNQTLEQYRNNALKSNDPQVQFDFANYLIDASEALSDPKAKSALQQEAIKIVRKLTTQNAGKVSFPEAHFFLAEAFGKGLYGLSISHDKAFGYYLQGSKQNHPAATYRVGVCYELGAGTKKDFGRAVNFYRKAASLGDPLSMHKLGMILLNGWLGQPKNPKEGVTWLKRTVNMSDNPQALHDLAACYETPNCPAVLQDESYALELYKKAAEQGYAPSLYKVGCFYEYGQLGCSVDPEQSIENYKKAADQHYSDAELALSGWYLTGVEGVLKQSDTDAYVYARKAADQKNAKAEYAVGYFSEKGIGVKPDIEEAKRWYSRSAAQGYQRAAERLKEIKKGKYHLKNEKKSPDSCIIM